MRIVFMGTPDFAVPALEALYKAGHAISGVFTQPDRPSGRGNKIKASPVKVFAEENGLAVYQPAKIKSPEAVTLLKSLEPECIVVVAFGQLLSKEILAIPAYGCINVHASLLPAYRGAAPVHWAVLNGETKTGVTTMLMDAGLDTGDMLLCRDYPISSEATTGELYDVLARMGAELILETLDGLVAGKIKPTPQPEQFTYAPLLTREHEQIAWSWHAEQIHNRIRGLNPWPGAFTFFRGEQVKIWQSSVAAQQLGWDTPAEKIPGLIIGLENGALAVQTGSGILYVQELQPAGKKRMHAPDFYNGYRLKSGEIFG
ncbi:methionyl-tRNA formyltransferase [Dehalobacter sp. DCM]|uniref:methionyl-tRNA formyltransferase n=1 Tax=Dehalobacter sp. DCM TaxID=2907827 RepID=UPI003081C965|nr:methionyl-tRNA formyltransferase [Dehalobacter sp. DCM]